ncbi:secreted protein containing domain of murein hydrolase, partial [Klebsiella oxytoca]
FEHYDEYPQDLLDMLARNVDLLDFVEGYPEKKGNVYADSVGEVEKGKIPLLLQWDERWGYGEYGDGIL